MRVQFTLCALLSIAPVATLGLYELQHGATLRAVVMLASIMLAVVLALCLGAHVSAPARRLSVLAGHSASGTMQERIQPDGPVEIARLAQDFNSMLDARDRAESALRDSEARLAAVIGGAMDAIVSVDGAGRISSFNAAAERLFARAAGEALGAPIGSLIPAQFLFAYRKYSAVLGSIGVGKPSLAGVWPIRAKRGDGGEVAVEVSVSRVEVSGGSFHMLILRDMSQRARAEAAQRAVDERMRCINEELERRVEQRTLDLQAANAELESFSYTIAHDLRAPLRSIRGFAQCLARDCAAGLPAGGRRYLDSVIDSSARMERLIADLLEFSRIGRRDVARDTVATNDLVSSVLEELLPAHGKAIDIAQGDLPQVCGDAALLRQVFHNLIANAVKFSANKPAPVIKIDGRVMDKEIIFSVADNGDGFDMNYAGKLFGVFQRLHSERQFEGTGIGLAIVQRIVSKHGGRVWAHAQEGEGATFQFSVPRPATVVRGTRIRLADLTTRMRNNG